MGGGISNVWLFGLGIFAFSIVLLTALLQSSVWIANKCLGPPERREDEEQAKADVDAVLNGQPFRSRVEEPQENIPPLGIRKGMVIVAIWIVVTVALDSLAGVWLGRVKPGARPQLQGDRGDDVALAALSLVTGFIVWCVLLTFGLPTTFNRAALVTLFLYIHVIVLTVAITIPVVVLFVLAG